MMEEEEKLACLEYRLVANVDFDDQALHLLDFTWDTEVGCNSLMECRQTPTRNLPRKFS
jgi:hypothetical protein